MIIPIHQQNLVCELEEYMVTGSEFQCTYDVVFSDRSDALQKLKPGHSVVSKLGQLVRTASLGSQSITNMNTLLFNQNNIIQIQFE